MQCLSLYDQYDNAAMTSQHQIHAIELTQATKPPKVLLVKLSSLGDVLHNLPIVWDIRKRLPEAEIDWIVEEAYVHLLEPLRTIDTFKGIDHIIPIALRRWRKNLFSIRTWREFFELRKQLQVKTYDFVLDTQGLLKSSLVCALAKKSNKTVVAGIGNATEYSGYEPIARLFYTQSVHVPLKCHAIDRSRWVMCSAFEWPMLDRYNDPPQFYRKDFIENLPPLQLEGLKKTAQGELKPYVLCFHATARVAKRWPNEHWIELGRVLSSQGYQLIFPWGSPEEMKVSSFIVSQIPGAIVPRAFSIEEAYLLLVHAAFTIGVDTGLTHLSAILGKRTVEIYCDSPRWKTEGYWSKAIVNLGDYQRAPSVNEVLDATSS